MTSQIRTVLDELAEVFREDVVENENAFIEEVMIAEKIVCVGAGRVGFAMSGFAKRLRHLGKEAHWIEDRTLPKMGHGDLMVVGSGSGETETIVCLGELAKKEGLKLALISATRSSRLSHLADVTVLIAEKFRESSLDAVKSRQPMTTLFEQSCQLYLDAIVLDLMKNLGQTEDDMKGRHNGIE